MRAAEDVRSDAVIEVKGITKTYAGTFRRPGVPALRGVDLTVQRGSIYGLLGPNGAGKSTLVKVLLTIVRRSGGGGVVLGRPLGDKGSLARIGYLPEHHRFPEYHTAGQVLAYFGAIAGVPRGVRAGRSGELLELVGLGAWRDAKVKGFSKGMRQRLGIANALMNDPDLVILDEPTDGVDPVGRRDIRQVLIELKRRGKTVLLNSHLLSELEMVCDRVAIMVQGLVTSQGTLDELTRGSRRYEIVVDAGAGVGGLPGVLAPMADWAGGMEGAGSGAGGGTARGRLRAGGEVVEVRVRDDGLGGGVEDLIVVETERALVVQPVIDLLRSRGVVIRAVRPTRHSLEDLFMRAVTDPVSGGSLAPGAAGVGGAASGGAR